MMYKQREKRQQRTHTLAGGGVGRRRVDGDEEGMLLSNAEGEGIKSKPVD